MRRVVVIASLLLVLAALVGCSARSQDAGLQQQWVVRGDDPASVVEGYFAEWEHGTLDATYLIDAPLVTPSDAPPVSIDRLDVFTVEAYEGQAVCEADFELAQVSADGNAVDRSEHTWVFELALDQSRGSYIITGIERD